MVLRDQGTCLWHSKVRGRRFCVCFPQRFIADVWDRIVEDQLQAHPDVDILSKYFSGNIVSPYPRIP